MAAVPEKPKLRPVEVIPLIQEGKKVICLKDPLGICEEIVCLPESALFFLQRFDGNHSIVDIQAAYVRKFGDLLFSDRILDIASQLDERYLLESPRFRERRREIVTAFRASPIRKAAHAGKSYPADPGELRTMLGTFFRPPGGPGEGQILEAGGGPITGAVAPHIDFARGGPVYAWTYGALREACDADLFVILGTCHAETKAPFVLTRKDFETPLGTIETDGGLVDRIVAETGEDVLADEFAHRGEHTIGFQTVWLRYAFPERKLRIVPILCGSFHALMAEGKSPADDGRIERFLLKLRDLLAVSGRRACVIASADLAHVGPQFGDMGQVDTVLLGRIEEADRAMLDRALANDAEGFYASVAGEGDRRRICGLPPIYALLRLLPGAEGRLLRYDRWAAPTGTVSFASAVFSTAAVIASGSSPPSP